VKEKKSNKTWIENGHDSFQPPKHHYFTYK
jgi:hypothetical protein